MTTQNLTKWHYSGAFFSGEKDLAGVEIYELCTGQFLAVADAETAKALICARYAGLRGRFDLRVLSDAKKQIAAAPDSDWNPGQREVFVARLEKEIARLAKRGGSEKCPVLA